MTQSAKTATNFDLSSLHILRNEIGSVLKDAEVHLREFYDDPDQAPLLLDSANNLSQLSAIFELIAFNGAGLLAENLSASYTLLHGNADGDEDENEILMTDISEAIMLLDRYVEFVLLKETPEPALLLPIINKLGGHLGYAVIESTTLNQNINSVIIADPQANYASLSTLGLNVRALTQAYRAGLSVILENKDGAISDDERQKLDGMTKACALIAQHSDTLFWQSAKTITQNIANDLPLSHAKKRILVYLEQQFSDYLPIEDRRFAEMVSFACNKNKEFATLANQKYALNRVSDTKFSEMQRFLFGPNREITDTLNDLIQEQIEAIKQKVDKFVRTSNGMGEIGDMVSIDDIKTELNSLSQTMTLLELADASQALTAASAQVSGWQNPTLEDLDTFLDKLLVAENSAIFLAKSHTPGAVKLPLHNREISLHQLDTSYETLVKEARSNLTAATLALTDYITDSNRDIMNLQNTPEMIRQVAGAAAFLRLSVTSAQLYLLARRLENGLLDKVKTSPDSELIRISNAWADVLVAADFEFENFEENRPTNEQSILISQNSLNQLVA
ncbi:hypothetical protein LP123_08225 [Moraxella bovis]|uniref:hypothetical protein n=1 Tax=Moraxella bovis TaxID=476 RepID=UPI002226B8D5|nr:hypothetical protein [Moraxella bovis]UYZ82312.1 hypothetical protein LP113_06360 [Moraxella bovis]UZA07333.1 hypothetical protein LP099_06060 [Moraxella bovis]UZA10431.1 hypothetical protein LP123_08225 [Moraxella bovis]